MLKDLMAEQKLRRRIVASRDGDDHRRMRDRVFPVPYPLRLHIAAARQGYRIDSNASFGSHIPVRETNNYLPTFIQRFAHPKKRRDLLIPSVQMSERCEREERRFKLMFGRW